MLLKLKKVRELKPSPAKNNKLNQLPRVRK